MRRTLTHSLAAAVAATALLSGPVASAQTLPPPENVVSLSASASTELPHDLLTVVLGTRREGPDAALVQTQLKQALDAALTEARRAAAPRQVDVRSGNFSLQPRYTAQGTSSGWVGEAELILEGRDVAGIAALAGRLQTVSVRRTSWSLSREARDKIEDEVAANAIAAFRARADRTAKAFGFSGWHLREVNVSTEGPRPVFEQKMAMARAPSSDASPLPVEAGLATVTVQVNGSVQLAR